MALPLLASPADLGALLGQTLADDDARARALLGRASTLVRTYTRQSWTTPVGTLPDDLPDAVREVTLSVAERAWRNPTGLRETAQAVGFSYSSGPAWSSDSGFYLSATDRMMLADYVAAPEGTATGLAVLATTKADRDPVGVWLPTAPGNPGDGIPWE